MGNTVGATAGELGSIVDVVHPTAGPLPIREGRLEGDPIMLTLLVLASGAKITPLIRFMLAGFECLTVGAVVLRVVDALLRPRLADLAAERRERWEAVHPVVAGEAAEQDDD
jgi:hypothetical protein